MKLTRSDLKSIVKECLVEILAEGVGSSILESKNAERPAYKKPVNENSLRVKKFDPALDTPVRNIQKPNTGNPIFDDILADTAKTTLPAMLQAESSKSMPSSGGTVERIVESSTPEQLFGDEASSKWAALAFSSVHNKT